VTATLTYYIAKPEGRHKLGVRLFTLLYILVIVWAAVYGFSYYRLPLAARAFHPLNRQLRPSGVIGIRLAILGVVSFCGIYIYPFRKRLKWLARIGKTPHWLDAHVVMGTGAPVLITLHSAFRMHGLAGTAYWIMLVVMASGFVGRYLYAQIPRRRNAAELSLQEMQNMTAELAEQLRGQSLVSAEELEPLLSAPA
jgi:cation transport ATPase